MSTNMRMCYRDFEGKGVKLYGIVLPEYPRKLLISMSRMIMSASLDWKTREGQEWNEEGDRKTHAWLHAETYKKTQRTDIGIYMFKMIKVYT